MPRSVGVAVRLRCHRRTLAGKDWADGVPPVCSWCPTSKDLRRWSGTVCRRHRVVATELLHAWVLLTTSGCELGAARFSVASCAGQKPGCGCYYQSMVTIWLDTRHSIKMNDSSGHTPPSSSRPSLSNSLLQFFMASSSTVTIKPTLISGGLPTGFESQAESPSASSTT